MCLWKSIFLIMAHTHFNLPKPLLFTKMLLGLVFDLVWNDPINAIIYYEWKVQGLLLLHAPTLSVTLFMGESPSSIQMNHGYLTVYHGMIGRGGKIIDIVFKLCSGHRQTNVSRNTDIFQLILGMAPA
jgi:hypothetical protein